MSSALGGAVVTFTALAAIGISGSVVLEAFQMKKTKTFRYLLTDTFILFAFGGLLIALGYFFCFLIYILRLSQLMVTVMEVPEELTV